MAEFKMRWIGQPRQMKFLRACGLSYAIEGGEPRQPVADIIGYGGAAGGGKSDALLMAAIIYCVTYPKARVGYFRRMYTQLEGLGGAIMRSQELLTGFATYNESKHVWKFPNGSRIKFCYLARDADVHNYQSTQFDVLLFDESTQFTQHQIDYMQSRIRSVKGYPTFTALATNPGGVSHGWFKSNFVRIGEPEEVHDAEINGETRTHLFIPARLADNLILERMDPSYRRKLMALPDMLKKQLLEGDWDCAEGMAFTEWRDHIHVIPPFKIPKEWIRFRALDWGFAKPYCVGWYAIDFDGRMYKYRELYGWGGKEDLGSREDPEDVAKKIMALEKREKISYAVADSAIFGAGRQDNHPSIAEQFADAFGSKAQHWQPITKGPQSRIAGKVEVHHRLKWTNDDPHPMLMIFNVCRHTIRTIPNLVLDENKPEDVDTTLEDHAYDETRYACMSRPMTPKKKPKPKTRAQEHKEKLAAKRKNLDPRSRIA